MKTQVNITKSLTFTLVAAVMLSACSRGKDPIPDIPPSDGTTLTLDGGPGEGSAENSVYVDLSAEQQVSVKRTSWNLGFYSGNEFRVILNGTTGTSAADAGTNDLAAVNSETFDYTVLASGFEPEKMAFYDDTAGRIEHTVIAGISANEADNNVYVVNTSFGSEVDINNVWKVRILRDGSNGYTLHYAKLDDTDFQTINVAKDGDYLFKHVSFPGGPVNGEPKKADWDFVWGYSIYYTAMGPSVYIPYAFSDLIFINHLGGVSAAEVIFEGTDNPTYADFTEADLSGVTFSNERNVISSNWRATTGAQPGVRTDRFYLIKDASGNVYKLRFISMGAGDPPVDGGKRGYPELEYTLVKRG